MEHRIESEHGPVLLKIPATRLSLSLEISDAEVVAELERRREGEERQQYALAALRLGVLALRQASGQIDGSAVREAGERLISDMRELLAGRGAEITAHVASVLTQYFDPERGFVQQRLDELIKTDGQLERILRQHLGPDESILARTLVSHLGEGSPVFKLLSPTEAGGLKAQVGQTLEEALKSQREHVLKEFSLDNKESALSRLVAELSGHNGQMTTDFKKQVDEVVKQFSLDDDNSALSRLMRKVEGAQKAITAEFSTDNEASALNRLSKLLENTTSQIDKNLTLDDENSALSRLKRELGKSLAEMVEHNSKFQTDVRETLSALQARKAEGARSTRHGIEFESQLGELVSAEAQRLGDIFEATGATTGAIKNNKTGDQVTQLGPESRAPGGRIVWEAKEHQAYDLKKALAEIEEARKNREAQIGIFVFSKKAVPGDLQPFARYDRDLVVVWDADDPSSDLFVKAAYSVARALAISIDAESVQTLEAVRLIEASTRTIEKQVEHLDQLKIWSETIQGNSSKLIDRVDKMKLELGKAVDQLNVQVTSLKQDSQI